MLSYVTTHLKGEQSLTRSFWVNTAALYAVLQIVFYFEVDKKFSDLLQLQAQTALAALGWALLWYGLFFLFIFWQILGCAASAIVAIQITGRKFWPRVVQFILFLYLLQAVLWFGVAVTQIFGFVRLAVFKDGLRTIEVSVVDKKLLVVSGALTYEIPEKIEDQLRSIPSIDTVRLDGPGGGRIGPARRIRDLIEKYDLATYVDTTCVSACTLAFVAGRKRIMREDAKFGFHQSHFPGVDRQTLAREEQIDKAYLLQRGIDPAFANKAYETPSDLMWFPSIGELGDAGFITHVDNGRSVKSVAEYCREHPCHLPIEESILSIKDYCRDNPIYACKRVQSRQKR